MRQVALLAKRGRTHPARIAVVEPSLTGGVGAMGSEILLSALRAAGHDAFRLRIAPREASQGTLFGPPTALHEASQAGRLIPGRA